MPTITEDYVSFETAKLLKEKGFRAKCNRYYNAQHDEIRTVSDTFMMDFNDDEHMKKIMMEGALNIPTQQMAMRWLREIHHLFIEVQFGCYKGESWYSIDIIPTNDRYLTPNDNFSIEYPTYEQACETAIKYCLENLI